MFSHEPPESELCESLHACFESDFVFDIFMKVVANILNYKILKSGGKSWRFKGLNSHSTETSDLERFH